MFTFFKCEAKWKNIVEKKEIMCEATGTEKLYHIYKRKQNKKREETKKRKMCERKVLSTEQL